MGVLGNFRNSVTIVNRTIGGGDFEEDLNVRYDGEDITLKPGENHGFPLVAVPFAKAQNPLKGTQHPNDPRRVICKVGVLGTKDPVTPIDEVDLAIAAGKLERVDRDGSFYGEPMQKVRLLKKTGYTAYEAAVSLPTDYGVNKNIE